MPAEELYKMINIYIGNDKIKILETNVSKRKVVVKNFFAITSPNDYIDNPDNKSFKELSQVIKDGIQEMQPKGKKIRVILDSNTIPYREMVLPPMPPMKMLTLIKNEIFTDEKLASTNTVDYVEADKKVDEQKRSKFFVTYVANAVLQDIENLIEKDMGFKLLSIDVAQNSVSKLISRMKNLKDQFVLIDYKDTSVTVYLFAYGKHVCSVSKPVISEPNPQFQNERVYFINEMSGIILDTAAFFKERYEGVDFDTVYVTGDVDKLDVCRDFIANKVDYKIEDLPLATFVEDMDEAEFNQFSNTLGGVFREG